MIDVANRVVGRTGFCNATTPADGCRRCALRRARAPLTCPLTWMNSQASEGNAALTLRESAVMTATVLPMNSRVCQANAANPPGLLKVGA